MVLSGTQAKNRTVKSPVTEQQQYSTQHGTQQIFNDRPHPGQYLHNASMSPVGSGENGRVPPSSTRWEPRAPYVPSVEVQNTVLAHRDGHSVSTTDASSNHAGFSTPESQQTSNTSYRDSENQADHTQYERQGGDDSFYWHSGRSSSDVEDRNGQDGSTTATPGDSSVGRGSLNTRASAVQREHQDLPVRSTSLSPTPMVPYGASALGFGGPSDWEYFGDYEAEEIDDEELYSRRNTRAELPADSLISETTSPFKPPEPPAIEPNAHKLYPISKEHTVLNSGVGKSTGEFSLQFKVPSKEEPGLGQKSSSTQSPTTPHATSDRVRSLSAHLATEDQRPDLDDVIRAWSEAPYIGIKPEIKSSTHNDAGATGTDDIAEASLASTPQERTLGVDLILRDAPSLPKLPESVDHVEMLNTKPLNNNKQAVEPSSHTVGNKEEMEDEPFTPSLVQHAPVIQATDDRVEVEPNAIPVGSTPEVEIKGEAQPGARSTLSQSSVGRYSVSSGVSNNSSTYVITAVDGEDTTQQRKGLASQETMRASHSESEFIDSGAKISDAEITSLGEREPLEPQQPSSGKPHALLVDSTSTNTMSSSVDDTVQIISEQLPEKDVNISNNLASHPIQDGDFGRQPLSSLDVKDEEPRLARPGSTISNEGLKRPLSPQSDCSDSLVVIPKMASSQTDSVGESPHSNVHAFPKKSQERTARVPAYDDQVIDQLEDSQEVDEHDFLRKVEKVVDPYSDLDPWGKASLNRFAAMLREEARAESNKDKLNIFNVFTSRESRLRVVLYGTDEELILPSKSGEASTSEQIIEIQQNADNNRSFKKNASVRKVNSIKRAPKEADIVNLEHSSKALPALPANRDSVMGQPAFESLAPLVVNHDVTSKTEEKNKQQPVHIDSYMKINSPLDDTQYSPGGRPMVAQLPKISGESELHSRQASKSATVDTAHLSIVEDSSRRHSQDLEIPIPAEPEAGVEVQNLARARKTNKEGGSEVNNYITNRRSVYRPFATQTLETRETGSNFDRNPDVEIEVPPIPTVAAPRSQYHTALQDEHNAITVDVMDAVPLSVAAVGQPSEHRRFIDADFDSLIMVLPDSEAVVQPSSRLDDLRNVIEAIPDDFSFIHASVVAWDTDIKKLREENDRQRHVRQMQSEQRIDALFDDHEIGYGDISELEAEFKQSEAGIKAEEDQFEYQTFVSDVFDLVWTRLHYELDQLSPHYENYSRLMNDTLAGKDIFKGPEDGLALAPTMSSFLALHQKLEIRHQKAFEAVLERDRRLKKVEISPWYSLSDIAKVKRLEKQFEDAEKEAIIMYCQQRDLRANRLMDVLDQNTLRGVGANQDYMEAIMKAVRRIASGRAFASVPGASTPSAGLEEVQKAKAITALLAASSEQIVQTFHVADMLLNSADYEVSVAKAKVSKADLSILAKLKEERAKEDQKLMRDLEHRLALIREDSRRTNDEIVKLMLFLGVQSGRAATQPQTGSANDPEHEARIKKALEDAKRRSALTMSES